ncbi:MAG: N-acetylmuramoyl-L-alanine amidase [Spirochaetales bacterium]|nr:N-acetylmuramoyl-L-alanine amidase [Spirochaetales bacterium]
MSSLAKRRGGRPDSALLVCLTLAAAFAGTRAADAQVPSAAGAPVRVADFASELGAVLSLDPLLGTVSLTRDGDRAAFKPGSPWHLLGDRPVRLTPSSSGPGGPLLDGTTAAYLSAWFEERSTERLSRFRVAAVLIDPGHGGKDPGAVGEYGSGKDKRKILEKDLALATALQVRDALVERFPDRRIMLSREADTYPSLEERVEMANAVELRPNEAIIYVSIHANASFNRNASGFEVWYLNPDYRRTLVESGTPGVDDEIAPIVNVMMEEEYTTESVLLARSIVERLERNIGASSRNRGIRAEEWFVVRNARMPSVLVEMGFVTNEAEARLLADPAHLRSISDAVYNGIVDFIDYFENRKGTSAP